MSLGLDQSPLEAISNTPAPRKSAGLAFTLSLFVPGLGQVYCGKTKRGLLTLVFFLVGVVVAVAALSTEGNKAAEDLAGIGIIVALVLYIFSFLDAYFVAREINGRTDALIDSSNPRVAVTLNLLTNGFGYWYLGERSKGWTAFLVLGVLMRAISRAIGDSPWSALLFLIPSAMAVDAYRLAHKQIDAAMPPAPALEATPTAPETQLPAAIPVALACLMAVGALVISIGGLMLPTFEPIDQSQAVTNTQSSPRTYSNPRYGVSVAAPSNWNFANDEKEYVVVVKTLEGACQVALIGQASWPLRSLEADADKMAREILEENKNFRRVADRSATFGNLGSGHEVEFTAKFGDSDVTQRYLLARKNMALWALVTTMASSLQPECEADAQWIREHVAVTK